MKNNIRLVTDSAAPSRLLQEHSPARMRLAEVINRKLAVESNLHHLADAMTKLQGAADAESNARAALNALDAQEAHAMAAWSKTSGPKPVVDRTRRDELKAALEDATAQATAARNAAASIGAEQQREAETLKQIEDELDLAVVPIIVDEVGPLLADFEAANLILAEKAAKISEAADVINLIGAKLGQLYSARPTPEAGQPAFYAFEQLSKRVSTAFVRRPAPEGSYRPVWMAFVAALKRDPIAEFKS